LQHRIASMTALAEFGLSHASSFSSASSVAAPKGVLSIRM
jgi:hypothetical protein